MSSKFLKRFLVISVFFEFGQASEAFQQQIPNGNRVPDPCNAGMNWAGVGHRLPGGTGPTNQFGQDFKEAGYRWTPALCRKDSDGDGKTNGQELGDPNCIWQPGLAPTITNTLQLSHPGVCQSPGTGRCTSPNSWLPANCRASLEIPPVRMSPTTCGPLPLDRLPANVYILTTPTQIIEGRYMIGANYELTCGDDYRVNGSNIVTCQNNGDWSTIRIVCQFCPTCRTAPVTLPPPPPGKSGCQSPFNPTSALIQALQQGGEYQVGTAINITCPGVGTRPNFATMTCRDDGSWTPSFLICTKSP